MQYFEYNKEKYYINDNILLKYKSRIIPYSIRSIQQNDNAEYIVKFTHREVENFTKTIKFDPLKPTKFIKKHIIYNSPPTINCSILRKHLDTIYKFTCPFCNKIHKHNYIGQQDSKCNTPYNPFEKSGYNLVLTGVYSNFNEYLLYNLELYLKHMNYKTYPAYKSSVKKFYSGVVCEDYGSTYFPYLTYDMLLYVKTHYREDNLKCSNRSLFAGLNASIKMVLSNKIMHYDKQYDKDIKKLYKFYKKNFNMVNLTLIKNPKLNEKSKKNKNKNTKNIMHKKSENSPLDKDVPLKQDVSLKQEIISDIVPLKKEVLLKYNSLEDDNLSEDILLKEQKNDSRINNALRPHQNNCSNII